MQVASPSPEPRAIGRLGSRRGKRAIWPWFALPLMLAAAAGGWLVWQRAQSSTAATTFTTATVSSGTLSLSVSGSGAVAAASSRTLAFATTGTVREVLVAVGDSVSAGQSLAALDTTELALALQQAEANLVSAQAAVAAANGEGATPEELAAAEASLRSAQAQYQQTVTGDVTATELASAQAQLASAQAQLDDLLDGASAAELSAAQNSVAEARLSLEAQRSSLSTAKSNAERAVATAANSLRDAQEAYSTLYWQNRQRYADVADMPQALQDEEAAAERAVANAELSYQDAQRAYEQAQQDEIVGIQQAELALASAQAELDDLQDGATAAEIASARASLASAQASLSALRQGGSASARAIAAASVEQAELSRAQLTAPSSASSIASAAASLAQAEVAVAEAKLALERATLVAPFDGVVAEVLMSVGDSAGSSTTITVLDPHDLYVELSLSESDVADVAVGQVVELSFDALPDLTLSGTIAAVAPTATVSSNVATYPVRVSFDPGAAPIKVGMTASGTIVTEERANALLVPTRAIQTVGERSIVLVRAAAGQPAVPVAVSTGLSSDGQTEILGCLDTSSQCLAVGDTLMVAAPSSAASGTATQSGNTMLLGPGAPPPGMGGRP